MKKAIIIGASSGIGAGLAKELAEHGYKVGVTGRRTELLKEVQQPYPASILIKTFDITDTVDTAKNLEELVSELGGLDLLVLSSGTGDLNDSLDFEIEKRTIDTNVTGFTCIADWAFTYFAGQSHGHMVAITSIAGLRGSRQAPAYNATKAYQINYLEALRNKATHLKIPLYITDIRPGYVDTAMAKGEGQFWVASVEKTAMQIFRAIERKKKIAYVTKRWRVVAKVMKRLPGWMWERL